MRRRRWYETGTAPLVCSVVGDPDAPGADTPGGAGGGGDGHPDHGLSGVAQGGSRTSSFGYGPGDNPGRTHLSANVGFGPGQVAPGPHANSLEAFSNRSPVAYALSRALLHAMPFSLGRLAMALEDRNAPIASPKANPGQGGDGRLPSLAELGVEEPEAGAAAPQTPGPSMLGQVLAQRRADFALERALAAESPWSPWMAE